MTDETGFEPALFGDDRRSSFDREIDTRFTSTLAETSTLPYRDGIVYAWNATTENGGRCFYLTGEIAKISIIGGQLVRQFEASAKATLGIEGMHGLYFE